jgi:hypothetical protein
MGDFGTMRKIVPVTTKDDVNKLSCFEVKGTQESPVSPQSIVPDLTAFNVSMPFSLVKS